MNTITQVAQVLNMMIQKKDNPDYWETARPQATFGMKPLQDLAKGEEQLGRTKTRWNPVKRNAEYIDFRGELSAFDKYLYSDDHRKSPNFKTKQDYLRYHSGYLKDVFRSNIKSFPRYKKEKIRSNQELGTEELGIISDILGKNYTSAKIVEHSLYKNFGFSVFFETNHRGYSEAFSGSGEMAVVQTVHKVFNAEKGSLILLDEPEVSLHPGAQKKLLLFLLEQIKEKQHQIVISTHSPTIVEDLPKEAITVLKQNSCGTFDPMENVPAELAFQHIGHRKQGVKRLLVEDDAAKQLIEKVLENRGDETDKLIEVVFHAGGADDLFKEALVLARLNDEDTYIYFDGDQKRTPIPPDDQISNSQVNDLILASTGSSYKSYNFAGDSKKPEQITQDKRDFLKFIKSNCFFLPGEDPEDTIWEASDLVSNLSNFANNCYKKRIKEWVESELGSSDAGDIRAYRKRLLNKMNVNHENIVAINKSIAKIANL